VYSFTDFSAEVEWRVARLARLRERDDLWPGLLILDVAAGLSAEAFPIGHTQHERARLVSELVTKIRAAHPRRLAWVMPCQRELEGRLGDCLLLLIAERGRVEAALADFRRTDGAPRLGPFNWGPFGSGARRVAGAFVEPLLAALDG